MSLIGFQYMSCFTVDTCDHCSYTLSLIPSSPVGLSDLLCRVDHVGMLGIGFAR